MKKIVQILPKYCVGGAEKITYTLCEKLKRKNSVFLIILGDKEEKDFVSKNINIIFLKKKSGMSLKCFLKLFFTLLKIKPDIVHTHLTSLEYAGPISFFLKAKFFHTIHNMAEKDQERFIAIFLRKLYFSFFVTPITISDKCSKSYRDFYSLQNDIQIKNAIDYPKVNFKNFDGKLSIVHIAGIFENKNQLYLAKEVKNFNNENQRKIILHFYGEIRNSNYFEELENYFDQHITYKGLSENIYESLNYYNYSILASHYEGLPLSLMESMSQGLIPISTNVGGISELFSNNEGFLFDLDEKEGLKNIFNKILHLSEKEYLNRSKLCIEKAERDFSINSFFAKHSNLYEINF
tara:strand:+ start:3333 stop:4382 length:1050 start_codon:yes stop_codon:yes gene_type:complete